MNLQRYNYIHKNSPNFFVPSFDNLYICGQANGNFKIVFGHYNTQNNQDNQDDSKSSN